MPPEDGGGGQAVLRYSLPALAILSVAALVVPLISGGGLDSSTLLEVRRGGGADLVWAVRARLPVLEPYTLATMSFHPLPLPRTLHLLHIHISSDSLLALYPGSGPYAQAPVPYALTQHPAPTTRLPRPCALCPDPTPSTYRTSPQTLYPMP